MHYRQFEKLLTELDDSIKSAYQSSGISDAERKKVEMEMLISGSVPLVLAPAVETLLGTTVGGLREEVDVAGLYFTDFSWLELGDDGKTKRWMGEKRLDVVRKSVIKDVKGGKGPGGRRKLKRCTRCCAVTEDLGVKGMGGMGGNAAMVQLQRNCLCGGWWMGV